jgi:hypothetical protein
MTAGTTQLAAEMESYIRHTQESKGRTITVLKQAGLAAFERRRGLVRLPVLPFALPRPLLHGLLSHGDV